MKTILVVDDEKLIRELCSKALVEYRILSAEDGEEALRLYEKESIDLVLSDVMMPGGLSGLELLRRIKEIDPSAVVIIMTGFSEKEVVLNALKEGADDFIHKPLNLLILKTSVEKALTKKKLKDEVANLKKMDRFKNNFLSLISHKFRTPITSISLFLQNSTHRVYDGDTSFMESAAMVLEEANYLAQMVDDLLVFSSVLDDGGSLEYEMCDLNLLINNVLMQSRDKKAKPGVETDYSSQKLPLFKFDRKKILFALQQIVDNAYKFSGQLGTVSISVYFDKTVVCITISDTGIGIPSEELPKIFKKFYQIDPDCTGQVRGFGLGLFYAREFIRQHNGGVTIDSQPGLGTTVTITLPCQ